MFLVIFFVLLNLVLIAAAYRIGGRAHDTRHDASGLYYTQALLAFAHYKMYGKIATELEKKCYDAALKDAGEMKEEQIALLADNLRRTGNDARLLEYLKLRDPELLKSVLSGHTPGMQPYTTQCP